MSSPSQPTAADARHAVTELLYRYTEIADRKDVVAGRALFAGATVSFPHGGFDDPVGTESFLAALWSAPEPHRHDVTNLRVERAHGDGRWRARAHYTRWVLAPDPMLTTLGEYDLLAEIEDGRARVVELVVTRTWSRHQAR